MALASAFNEEVHVLLCFIGWVRQGWRHWHQPSEVFDAYEPECWAKLKKWIETNRKRRRGDPDKIDLEGDGETVVLLAGTPPWLPCPPKAKEE